jgi:acetylglutamate kinase
MKKVAEKAEILIEALPYIQKFRHKTIVVKYGGSAMIKQELKNSFAQDLILLKLVGINPIIVHGGGPQIGAMMSRLGKKSRFFQGMRVTDAETMEIVEMVLGGRINKEIVGLIDHFGGKAVGLSGKDGQLIRATKLQLNSSSPPPGEREPGGTNKTDDNPPPESPEDIDLGLVGRIQQINPEILFTLEHNGFIPVIAPIGKGDNNETYNINADDAAGEIAVALKAEKLILLTDTPGVLTPEGELLSSLTIAETLNLIKREVITGGMLPKVKACLRALEGQVPKAHIIDGRVNHALILEIFTEEGIGTQIIP